MRNAKPGNTAVLKRPLGNAVIALTGLLAAAACLLLFVSDLSHILEMDVNALVASFVLCGLAAGIGLYLLRRLAPKGEVQKLFGQSSRVTVEDLMHAEIAPVASQVPLEGTRAAVPERSAGYLSPVMVSHGSENVARYKTHEGVGFAGFMTMAGMIVILVGRFGFGWQFFSLAIVTGIAMAIGMYWMREHRQSSQALRYAIPVAGGVVGFGAMAGMAIVMMRFAGLRDFLALSVGAGIAVALFLQWRDRRHSSSSLVTYM